MNVARILQTKGGAVHTISASAKISDAVEMLNRNNIGALIVSGQGGEVTGILSERDIVRRLHGFAGAVLLQSVSACMTPNPVTCTREHSIDEVMQLMTKKRIRHLPVVEDGKLLGLISIGDVVKRKIEITEEEAAALREYIAS